MQKENVLEISFGEFRNLNSAKVAELFETYGIIIIKNSKMIEPLVLIKSSLSININSDFIKHIKNK